MPKPPSQKMHPQKILVVIATLHKGGAERVVSRLIHHWVSQGHEVTLALCDVRNPAYPLPPQAKILDLRTPQPPSLNTIHKALAKAWHIGVTAVRLTRHLRQHRHSYHHIIGFMEDTNIPLIMAGCLTSTLSRITVSVRLSPRHMVWAYKWVLLPILYRLPKRVVAVSQSATKQLQDLGIPHHKLTFIPNPVPIIHSKPPPPQFAPKKTKAKTKYILAVGRLHRQKGFDLLLRAYAGLPKLAPLPDLVILGEGKDRLALTRLAASLGVAGGGGKRVHFMGAVDNPQDWYAHAEMFVLSSRYEGWPNVLMEAMAYGCPVVSFACPTGPDEIIAPQKNQATNGLLVKNGDIAGLTRAMHKLLTDKPLRRRLATAGKVRAGAFALEGIAEQWLV